MRTGAKLTVWGNLVKDPEYITVQNGGVRMKAVVMINWTDFKGQKQSAAVHASMFLNQERYAKVYPIFEGSKGRPVMVTGDFRPSRAQVQPGKQYADFAWLNVERADIEALWSRDQAAVQAPVQTPVQHTPAPVVTAAAPPPAEWGNPQVGAAVPAPVPAAPVAGSPVPPPPPPTA